MCTLSFLPSKRSFLAAMNRDESHTRPAALPPRILEANDTEVICPREVGGGTWIACNEQGNLLALLNWHVAVPGSLIQQRQTRGSVIPALITARNSTETNARLSSAFLAAVLPFRLVGVFRSQAEVCEWGWDGSRMTKVDHPWARRHWFSSSISDSRATEERLRTIESAVLPSSPMDEVWLRKLHASHSPAPGPFSLCVHRPDASTVSYTMVRCDDASLSMGYLDGSPCRRAGFDALFTTRVRAGGAKAVCT